MNLPALEVQYAYSRCEEITRAAAANFYYGIRLLPQDKRQAMSAVYAFARQIDDIGDEPGDPAAKLTALRDQRGKLARIAEASSGVLAPQRERGGDPVSVALADAHVRFALPLDALELLIEGVELDVNGATYETFEDLVVYCRDVAGTIGRLCLAIFTDGHGAAHAALADDLGVALQLTNILRDVREDYANGRVYLPAEDLRRFGVSAPELSAELIRFEAERARDWFDHGLALMDELDGRSAACLAAMTGIYRRILERILADPEQVLQRRISLPTWEKALVAARSLATGSRTRSRAGGAHPLGSRA